MILDILDDDVIDETGQIAPPRRRGRPASAQAKREVNVLFADKVSAPPSESWWLNVPAEGFTRRADQEQERMQTSKFGRMKGNIPTVH